MSFTVRSRVEFIGTDPQVVSLLETANRAAIAATVFLAAGMSAAVYLITDFLFGEPATAAVTATLGALFIWLWYGLPLVRRMRERD